MDQQTNNQIQPPLPNATAILVLGILSIVICFITGIIALIMAKKEMALYESNPGMYSAASYNNVKTGRICAIIGLVLQGIGILCYILFAIIFVSAIGAAGSLN